MPNTDESVKADRSSSGVMREGSKVDGVGEDTESSWRIHGDGALSSITQRPLPAPGQRAKLLQAGGA
jgi:hypothetical protein